jgi:hypothetical protein
LPKKRFFETFDDFLKNLHKEGTALIDFNGNKIPCIYINPKKYDEIMNNIYGKKLAVDTLLNIFYDGRHVFVDVQMKFLNTDLEENYYLLYANDMLEFFEALSNTGLIALAPDPSSAHSNPNVFMVQLPKKDAAENALQIIKANVKNKKEYLGNKSL